MLPKINAKKFCVLGIVCLTTSLFSTMSYGGDQEKGKKIFEDRCVLCHGIDGKGVAEQEGPRIAGQFDWYIEKQLGDFLTKKRKNEKMDPYIQGLSKQDIKDLSAHISQLK